MDNDCDLCWTSKTRSVGPGSIQSTPDDCERCQEFLEQAEWRLQYAAADLTLSSHMNDPRSHIAATLVNLNRPLEALNFCLSSLNRSSLACPSHPYFNPVVALQELNRYQKSDFDPNSPPSFNVHPHPHTSLPYMLVLASVLVYGPSTFAISCLRRAHLSNPYIFGILTENKLAPPPDQDNLTLFQVEDASIYHEIYQTLWRTSGTIGWLRESEEQVKKKACDAVECAKVEERVGQMKVCTGCRGWWYCSVECQKRDWTVGGHKKACKVGKEDLVRLLELQATYRS